MIMNHTAARTLYSSLVLVLTVAGCNDERLRELGYTIAQPAQPSPPDPGAVDEDLDGDCEGLAPEGLISADAITRAVAADVAAAPGDARPFLRYASVANALNAGRCASIAGGARGALAKLLNGVSREPVLVRPAAVDEGDSPTLLRIDLRDYGLAREISLGGEAHQDGWEAIVASSPYAIALGGADGAFLAAETGTATPWLSVDAIVQAVAEAPLYYALAGVPPTLGELRQQVGLPAVLDPFRDGLPRAATSRSRVLRAQGNLRTIDRYATADGTYWEALQIETTTLLADPLHAQPDAQRLISFNLPNGLLAFAVTDARGDRQAAAELLLDTNLDDFQGTVLISCTNCHAQGLIPVNDELRDAVLPNPDLFADDVVDAYSSGPDAEERFARFQVDAERHLDALEGVGVPSSGSDPISQTFLDAAQELDANVAAADLLVSPETLRARLSALPPELLPLGLGLRVSRAQFGAVYARAFCTLHAADANPPAAPSCE